MWDVDHRECRMPKNWCFWTVVLEKTLESPFDSKEIKSVNPKGNQPWHSLEGLLLKLKLQYFGHLMRRANSMEKTLVLRKIEGRRRRVWQRMRWLDGINNSMEHEFELWEIAKGRQCAAVHGVAKSQTSPSKWTTIITAEGWDSAVYLTFFKVSFCFQDRDRAVRYHLHQFRLHGDLWGAVFQKLHPNGHICSWPDDLRDCHQKPGPKGFPTTREKWSFFSLHLHSFEILKFHRWWDRFPRQGQL